MTICRGIGTDGGCAKGGLDGLVSRTSLSFATFTLGLPSLRCPTPVALRNCLTLLATEGGSEGAIETVKQRF